MGNSVIYRPAYDAEVEYLQNSGGQKIDTGILQSSDISIELDFQFTDEGSEQQNILRGISPYAKLYRISPPYIHYDFNGVAAAINTRTDVYERHKIYICNGMSILDEVSAQFRTTEVQSDKCIFMWYDGGRASKIYSLKLWDNNVLVRDFIPVRIGSTGYMYDKVSKQLFANKGTGNFILGNDVSNAVIPQQRCVLYFGNQRSVGFERIYEEYEWLCGDGSAYINTNVSDLSTIESIYCYFIGNGIETQRVFGRDNKGHSRFVTQQAYNQIRVYTDGDLSTDLVSPNNEEGYILIDYKNATAETKYSQGTIVKNTITTGPNLILFGNNWGTSISNFFTGKIHKFEIKNILSFIPCKLLQSIPAILDGNGIARQAGECGMWDKVSNKFYGNVANSGSFTVSND